MYFKRASLKKFINLNNIDAFASFIIYGVGLLATLLSDLYVSRRFSVPNISEYAFLKSCVFILGTFCLLGYDQLLVRDPTLITRVLKSFLIQALLICFISALSIHFIKNYSYLDTFLIFCSIYFASLLTYFAAAARANFDLWQSQFYSNFWRVLVLILLFFSLNFNLRSINIFLTALACNCIFAFFVKGFTSKEKHSHANSTAVSKKDSRKMGLAFVFHNTTLILAIYGEQFFINLNGDSITSSHLFKYTSIFTPIAIAINGFLGFYYGPKIRKQQSSMNAKKYISFTKRNLAISFFNTILSVIAGLAYLFYISTKLSDIDILIICSLSVMCVTRGVYISSSVCLGIFGSFKTLRFTALLSLICTICYILLIYTVLHFFSGIIAARLISLCTLSNWLIRFFIYNHYSIKSIKEQKIEDEDIPQFKIENTNA